MVKQSRVTCSVSSSLAPGAVALKDDRTKRVEGNSWKTVGRVSGVFAVGLLAALVAPREAKAIGFFTLDTATALPAIQPCQDSQPGCYTSWVTTADIDGDGDMDILLANGGGYYVPGKADESVVYLNNGSGVFTDATPTAFNNAHNRNRQIAVADVDGDGDLDIYQPGAFGYDLDKLFIQTAPGVYEDRAATQFADGSVMSHAGSCHMGDLDGDGDMDIINMDWNMGSTNTIARAIMYTNDGTGKFTLAAVEHDGDMFTPTDRLPATIPGAGIAPTLSPMTTGTATYWGVRPIDVDFADVDNDFDIDILVNMRNGFSRIFINDGHGNFKDGTNWAVTTSADGLKQTITTNYPIKQGPYVYNQETCDIDDDGDIDMLIDNVGPKPVNNYSWAYGGGNGGTIDVSQVLINDGHGKFVDDTANRITGEPGGDDNGLKCADLNNDNHYDLIVATLTGRSEKLLMNDGKGHFNFVSDGIPYGFSSGVSGDSSLYLDLADFNGDKMLDMVTGQGENGNFDEKVYYGGGGSVPDTNAPIFRAIETPAPLAETPTVIRYALRDSVTNEAGQMIKSTSVTYNLAGGAPKTVKGTFYGADLFRATIPAQVAGSVVTVKISATDRFGNTTNPPATFTYKVPTPVPPPVVAGSGGSGGGAGSGGATAGTGGTSAGGASAGSGGTSAGSGGAAAGSGGASAGSGGAAVGSGGTGEAGAAPGEGDAGGEAGETSAGGEAGETNAGGASSLGGSSSSTGGKTSSKGGSSSNTAGSGEAGEPPTTSGGGSSKADDGGCSVSPSAPATKGRNAALLGFGLAMLGLVRRRRNSKQ